MPARIMIAAITSEAIGSARSSPASRIRTAAPAVASAAYRSVSTCWRLPSMFRLRRSAPASSRAATTLASDAHERDQEHQGRVHVGRGDQPADSLVGDEGGQDQQRDPVRLRREDLGAGVAEGHRARGPGGWPAAGPAVTGPARRRRRACGRRRTAAPANGPPRPRRSPGPSRRASPRGRQPGACDRPPGLCGGRGRRARGP